MFICNSATINFTYDIKISDYEAARVCTPADVVENDDVREGVVHVVGVGRVVRTGPAVSRRRVLVKL